VTSAEFKKQLRDGELKMGLFVNSHSPTVAEQLAHSGYDWLLIDMQHGPMGYEKLSAMLCAVASGGAKSMVRVAGYSDRAGIQQALDLGADGGELRAVSDGGHAVCLFPAAFDEQGRAARLRRRRQGKRDCRATGGDGIVHREHG
jgi:2-keto-3-deoxy-L-rhamnonate aldolase RhmA